MARFQARYGLRVGLRRGAQQKEPVIFFRSQSNQQRREVRAGDPFRQRVAQHPRGPDQRRAIAQRQRRIQ